MPGLSLRDRRLIARGINPRRRSIYTSAAFAGLGNRAVKTLGTGNSAYHVMSRTPGSSSNNVTFRVVVSGTNTAASVSVVGQAVTFNAATDGAGVATSKVIDLIRTVNRGQSVVHVSRAPGSDATGTVAAVAATNLAGAS